ncbi:hypothetical protein GIB67_038676 [Kingdonia uniflora]|uniref:Pectinesterase inhibitor domain-containing protein n=1 Tax=Kingdonia uniflora TaxID=39325 RepID=A0A7J7NSS1_9MAGN|nr:hypothetical protein GIB67_038676 [Kingdonia uniflora]
MKPDTLAGKLQTFELDMRMENPEKNKSVAFKSSSSSKGTIDADNSSDSDNDDGSDMDSQIALINYQLKNLVQKHQFQKQSNQEQDKFDEPNLEDLYPQTLAKYMKLSLFLEKEVNEAKKNMKSTLDELRLAKLDIVLSQQKLEKFCHRAKNIDKMLYMGKTDCDKRGLGYDEPLPNAKTPQIINFVKASTSVPKHNMISTTHNHTKRVTDVEIGLKQIIDVNVVPIDWMKVEMIQMEMKIEMNLCQVWVSALSRGYPTSVIVHGATTAGLTLNRIQDLELRREIGARRCKNARRCEDVESCENRELIAGSSIIREVTTGCAYRVSVSTSRSTNLHGLGIITTMLTHKNVTRTHSHIKKLLKRPNHNKYVKNSLDSCLELYGEATASLKEIRSSIKGRRYDDANIQAGNVMDLVSTCEDGFTEGGVKSPLTKNNGDVFQLVAMDLSIINMLS